MSVWTHVSSTLQAPFPQLVGSEKLPPNMPDRYLFGSHATGNPEDDSDVDLLAVVPDTDRSTREIAIEGRSSLRDFLISFDLIVCTKSQFDRYADVKNTIMNEVLYDGRLVYGC